MINKREIKILLQDGNVFMPVFSTFIINAENVKTHYSWLKCPFGNGIKYCTPNCAAFEKTEGNNLYCNYRKETMSIGVLSQDSEIKI